METKQRLEQLHIAIFNERGIATLRDILHDLHEIYSNYSGIRVGDMTDSDIALPSGKAISPTGAAHCLIEMARTSKFLQGIRKAVLQLRSEFNHEPIRILYAGCGPYATLVTPLTSIFSPSEITFDILDINEISLGAVKKMYSELGLLAYVNNFIKADAATYQIPANEKPHLIISETMNAGLKTEPQVEIMLNLMPQLMEGGIFIPEKIAVDAYLLDPGKEQASFFVGGETPERLFLGNIYTIGQTNCVKHPPTIVKIPKEINGNDQLSMLTEITVFGNEQLHIYDCSLTLPQKICKIDDDLKGKDVQFSYIHGPKPHFEHHFITAGL
jgi:hypothetical protein